MRLGAPNQIKGLIVDIRRVTARVRLDIGGGVILTASMPNEAVDDLGLSADQVALAVIKASDVMIGIS
jgi:molybdopterin-binding protein